MAKNLLNYRKMSNTFQDLLDIMQKLRSPRGCPWDREQNFNSLLPYLLEESYEYIDAVQNGNTKLMAEELGDVFLQVVFHAQIAKEEGKFTIDDVIKAICEKMVRRHPHVFGSENLGTSAEVLKKWEEIKDSEKEEVPKSAMDKVPRSMVALSRAQELSRRAAKVGFDWNDSKPVLDKVKEEIEEFELEKNGSLEAEEEFGDILFALVNLARHKGINAETALARANAKFEKRFRQVEILAGGKPQNFTLEELDKFWNKAKAMMKTAYISIYEAAEILKKNGIVAIPTETVYGLAGNALSETAVAKIFAAKERPFFDPLIVHIAEFGELENLAAEIPKNAKLLAEKFWPGPLTLILPKKEKVPNLTTGGLSTVAVRMPQKQITRELIKLAGFPLAAPSANMFQHLSPTSAEHVVEQLNGRIDGIVNGGVCEVGIESTVVGFESGTPVIYRPGAVTKEMIAECLGHGVLDMEYENNFQFKLPSPGLLKKHYSPNTPLCFELPNEIPPSSGLLAFGKLPANANGFAKILNLSENANPTEAAANLYGMLHKLDSYGLNKIFTMLLPETGLGNAVNDRLIKASGG
jgi:tRNA threonylcarbamoyl adenosine modification protein (Sua5/YciO/YrdC/YwlC family)